MRPYSLLMSRCWTADDICFYMCNYIYERDVDLHIFCIHSYSEDFFLLRFQIANGQEWCIAHGYNYVKN